MAFGFPVLGRVSEMRVRGAAQKLPLSFTTPRSFCNTSDVALCWWGSSVRRHLPSLHPSRPWPVLPAPWATQSAPGMVFHFGMCPHTLSVPSACPPVSTLARSGTLAFLRRHLLRGACSELPRNNSNSNSIGRVVPRYPRGVTCVVSPVFSQGGSPCRGVPSCLRRHLHLPLTGCATSGKLLCLSVP